MAEESRGQRFAMFEAGGWSILQLAGWPQSRAGLALAIASASGLEIPREAGAVSRAGRTAIIRLDADRFWFVDESGESLARHRWDPAICSVTALGQGRAIFSLTGDRTREVLAKCVALDWDNPRLAPGRAAQTMLHRVPVLIRRDAVDDFVLCVPRSYAQSVREWIEDAAA